MKKGMEKFEENFEEFKELQVKRVLAIRKLMYSIFMDIEEPHPPCTPERGNQAFEGSDEALKVVRTMWDMMPSLYCTINSMKLKKEE
jgi:hypothetical protein